MIEEPFVGMSSRISSVDPRMRVIVAFSFSLVVAFSRALEVQVLGFGLAWLVCVGGGVSFSSVVRRLAVVNGFILFLWLVVPFSVPGPVVYTMGPLQISQTGLLKTLQITLKANAIVIVFIVLIATMSVATLGHTLASLGMPGKMCHLLLLTYRYIFVFEEESRRLHRAATLRGFTPTNSLRTYRTYAYMVGMILVRAWERADRVQDAMVCRGFTGRLYCLTSYSTDIGDWVFFGCASGVIFSLAILEYFFM